ncbi:carbonic anhydrase [Kushneria sinocarnis]|uniref:Carbonic anhydrase n=1 Tax=Kushneria sinocarnis TaxID=595502 RepID=A0A420WYG6_9GAMM|nr:carbonate dehydratase [Kushneria sinocarnis]RKR06191.1 carbonic anhydrase [Kushneria sinocarnis]
MHHSDDPDIQQLLDQNRRWSEAMQAEDPEFFSRLSSQQNPDYLWIGCSDSRVPANQIIDLPPGEVFVHRNVANILHHNDMNALSVVEFAVDVLKVRHIMIVGHYGCGGVRAALADDDQDNGLVDYWLHSIRALYHRHHEQLSPLPMNERIDRMCELNVKAQVHSLCSTRILQRAWQRGQSVAVHGWCYSLADGSIHDLECSVHDQQQAARLWQIESLTE